MNQPFACGPNPCLWVCRVTPPPQPEECLSCLGLTIAMECRLTLPVIPDASCDCSNIGGEHILTQNLSAPCTWDLVADVDLGAICGGTRQWRFSANFNARPVIGGNIVPEVRISALDLTTNDEPHWFYEGAPEPGPRFDCSGPFVVPYFGNLSAFPSLNCIWTGLGDATVEMIFPP